MVASMTLAAAVLELVAHALRSAVLQVNGSNGICRFAASTTHAAISKRLAAPS